MFFASSAKARSVFNNETDDWELYANQELKFSNIENKGLTKTAFETLRC